MCTAVLLTPAVINAQTASVNSVGRWSDTRIVHARLAVPSSRKGRASDYLAIGNPVYCLQH